VTRPNMSLLGWTRSVRELFVGDRQRGITLVGDRAYVEYRGVPHAKLGRFSAALSERARVHANVSGVHVNALTRRVSFHFVGAGLSHVLLTALVRDAERTVGATRYSDPTECERALPDDQQLDQEYTLEACADAFAFLWGLSLRVVPLVPRRLGTTMYGALLMISEVESLRAPLDERLGRERADFVLHIALALAQGWSQRPLSSLVDLSEKLVSLRELRARRSLFQQWADRLCAEDAVGGVTTPASSRPCELPKGPIENYADKTWQLAASAFGVSFATTRSPGRAVAAGFAALPQPARLGRELFVAELGRVFARHGMLVLSQDALRRLDRIDTLVLPADLVAREQFLVGDVFALRGITRVEALARARRLFRADRPLRVQRNEGYALGPARLLPGSANAGDAELESAIAERESRGALVLALAKDEQVLGLVEVQIFPEGGVVAALAAARRFGLSIVLAADDPSLAEGLNPDQVIGLTLGLSEGIRKLQLAGKGVCFVGRGPSEGYAAADLGLALVARNKPTPWGAHVLCPDDTRSMATLIESIGVARSVSEQSVRLALGAAALGTLASAAGHKPSAGRRVLFVVNLASMASMLNAVRRTSAVERERSTAIDPTPWHALGVEGVLARLGSSNEGLAADDDRAVARRAPPRPAWLELGAAIQKELMSPLAPLLALGAGMSAVVGSLADAGIVAGVGGINALIGGVQRFKTERAISELGRVAEGRVHVRRSGRLTACPADQLQRGDVLLLSQGDLVPADCRILEAESLEVDTSSLTGESLPVRKGPAPSFAESIADVTSMLYAGTSIAAGRVSAVVVATGDETVARRAALSTPDEARGGVEGRLRELMRLTGPVAFGAGAALVAAGMLRGRSVGDLVTTGVGLAVAAVPEGLPVLATAAQLAAAARLSVHGTLVKNPRAIEALGRVDVLCIDKTGTLTHGHIELSSVYDGDVEESIERVSGPRLELLRAAVRAVARDRGISVDPLDAALVHAAQSLFRSRSEPPPATRGSDVHGGFARLAERAFESGRGFEAVLGRAREGARLYVKGAPELLLSRSRDAWCAGERQPIKRVEKRLLSELERMASRGLRVIAVAEREVDEDELAAGSPQELLGDPTGLSFLGFVAFRDPVRESAKDALASLQRAGVRTVMITGDHASTAYAIANEVELPGAANVLPGGQIAQMDEAELELAVERTSVFARVTPAQKVRVVRALQRRGHVVGMVGDGANDAPAMRVADAGIAVGKSSTEAARAASDIVLTEPRIDSLLEIVVEGRAMWTAVRDAVSILVGGNLGEIGYSVAIGLLTGRAPLNPRQLLLVNFLTDVAPSMAIALRAPSVQDLAALRHATPESALGAPLDREILGRALTTSLGAGGAWTSARLTGGGTRARTVGLVGLVGTQLGQTLLKGGSSRAVLITSLGSVAALGLIIQTPGLSQLFGCTPLGPLGWTTGLVASATATAASPLIDRVVGRGADLVDVLRSARAPTAPQPTIKVEVKPPATVTVLEHASRRMLRN
jgi:cation-transporting P-type ATPase I